MRIVFSADTNPSYLGGWMGEVQRKATAPVSNATAWLGVGGDLNLADKVAVHPFGTRERDMHLYFAVS